MHIEHKQFLDLIAEASGIDLEKAEKQLSELVNEIKQSLGEGEAYEIEGFGIFSSLGNRVMFIPSDELETEINFKYVGMEPIELDEPKPTFDDPFDGLDEDSEESSIDSRFAGLIDDDITDPLLKPEDEPGPEMWGVEAHKEKESADRLFASLMGEDYEAPLDEAEGIDTGDNEDDDDFSDVFAENTEVESSEDLGAEVAAFMSDDSTAEENPSTDDDLDDIFSETDEIDDDFGEDLILEENDVETEATVENESFDEEPIEAAPILNIETSTESDFEIELPGNEESIDELIDEEFKDDGEESIPEIEESENFDDPFYAIEDEQFDESVLRMEDLDETEIIPVIKNITTDVPEAEPEAEKEKSKKELQKEERERKKLEQREAKEKKKEEKERLKQEKKEAKEKAKAEKGTQPTPVWMWVVLIIVVIGGGVVGLGYFSIINVPFITPTTASNTVTTTPAQEQTAQVQQPINTPETSQEETVPVTEQAIEEEVEEPAAVVSESLPVEGQYGLTGQVSTAGNDGYTIILYTLSNQNNAVSEAQKLIDAGYRGFLTPRPSERYGTLYRVSVGQFGSLFDAAVAAEEIESLLPENYIIKKIN